MLQWDIRQASALRPAAERRYDALGLRATMLQFALFAGVVTLAGTWLPVAGTRVADEMGWSRTFVGTLLVAGATSLPEVVVTLAALRLRALDMAIGGLLGSNLFDLLIIAVDDLFYTRGPLLADAAPVHAGTAVAAVVMSGLVMVGLVLRPQGRLLRVFSWISVGLLAVYALNATLVFLMGT